MKRYGTAQADVKRNRRSFRQLRVSDDKSDSEEYKYQNELHPDRYERTVFSSGSKEVNPSFQAIDSRTSIKPEQIHILRGGDHIGWQRPNGLIWHHAIICDTDYRNNRIMVIHFKKVNKKMTKTKEWLDIYKEKGDLFRFDYSENTNKSNPPDTVLKRANAQVGETKYHVLANNCEHFATYCKTGIEDSVQVHWANGKRREIVQIQTVNWFKSSIRLASNVAKSIQNEGCRGLVRGAVNVGGAEVFEHAGGASNWVGAGLVVAIETVHCGYDIYQMYQSKDFKVSATQRVSEGIAGGGLAIGASIAGQYLGGALGGTIGSLCAPVIGTAIGTAVGAFFGSVLGGGIGSTVGKGTGISFGHWLGNKLFG